MVLVLESCAMITVLSSSFIYNLKTRLKMKNNPLFKINLVKKIFADSMMLYPVA